MTKLETCPHCHQPMRGQRLGVYLSPRRCDVFDIIKAAGEGGASTTLIANRLGMKTGTVRATVLQINEILEATEWTIFNFPGGGSRANAYELVRRSDGR